MRRAAIPAERIERSILVLHGHKALLHADLAKLYDVETKVLLQALKRNPGRFPKDFMFQLTDQKFKDLRSQFVTSSWGGRRYAPYVFTEQGVAMLSSVLNSSTIGKWQERTEQLCGRSPPDVCSNLKISRN